MKILLFGGAFDPPHLGHIGIVKHAIEHEHFDKVIVMPTGTPTHKNECVAPFEVRKLLAQKAFLPISPIIEVSDYEGKNLQNNYSYLTIEYLKDKYNTKNIKMLIGGDSLLSLESWFESEQLLKNCGIVAFHRDNYNIENTIKKVEFLNAKGADITLINSKIFQISSSEIRKAISNNEDAKKYIQKDVCDIINQYAIYDNDDYIRVYNTSRLLLTLMLDEARQIHTYNVEKLAVRLCKTYNLDIKKASLAAILHDLLKNAPRDILLQRAIQSETEESVAKKPFPTLHGFAAADYAKKELKITDMEILKALKSHTCGRKGMKDFEKIIYLSDMLCEERVFPQKEYLLEIAYKNLDLAMEKSLEQVIIWLNEKQKPLGEDSIESLAYFKDINNPKGILK